MPRHLDLAFDRAALDRVPTRRMRWRTTYRLQSARHPPVDAFERVAPAEDREALHELERMTDPAARQDIGRISLVPPSRRVFGPGASALMWPFTHPSKDNASRFSDGAYGVYYAGHAFETALREVAYHRGRFHAQTRDEPTRTTFKTIEAGVDKVLQRHSGRGLERSSRPRPCELRHAASVRGRAEGGRKPRNRLSKRQASNRGMHRRVLAERDDRTGRGQTNCPAVGRQGHRRLVRFREERVVAPVTGAIVRKGAYWLMYQPPLGEMTWPVMNLASSLAR